LTTIEKSAVEGLAKRLAKGDVAALEDVLRALAPREESAPVPKKVPTPAKITDSEQAAIETLSKVYGSVVPTERRTLTKNEVKKLLQERAVLKELEKCIKRRVEDITLTAHNHFDVTLEETGAADDLIRNAKGYYVHDDAEPVPDLGEKLTREARHPAPTLNPVKLQEAVVDDSIDFTHQDYLASTRLTRVFDENKFMLLLRQKPEVLAAVSAALEPGKPNAAINVRPIKD
jgi:hypothetical protein